MAIVDNLVHLLLRRCMALREAIDLNLIVSVFLNGQLLLTVEKIDVALLCGVDTVGRLVAGAGAAL